MAHQTTTFLLIPGLLCTSELYSPQLPMLWHHAPVMVANHTHENSVQKLAKQILTAAPQKFVLMGFSMGGYLTLEIMRQGPEQVHRVVKKKSKENKTLVATNKRMAQAVGVQGFANQQQAIMDRPDSRPGLSQITCPTLILVGEQDQLISLEHSQEMADAIPNAKLEIIPDCGHISTLEQPQAVNKALETWLGKL